METQAATLDAFDRAVVTESTSREAVATDATADASDDAAPEKPAPARDASGKFTTPASAAPADPTDDFDTDDEAEAAPEPPKPAAKKPRNDPQARIDQAIARQREAERRAEEAERRARDIETRQTPQTPRTDVASPKPAEEKFPSLQKWLEANPQAQQADDPLSEYFDARFNHWRDQERKQATETQQTQQLETTFAQKASAFGEQYTAATTADPDVVGRINQDLLTVRPYSLLTAQDKAAIRAIPNQADRDRVAFMCFLADHWIESEHAVALLEHVSDPTTFQRLATLPPSQVTRELAKLEAGIGAASRTEPRGSVPQPITTSKARPPIKPLGTTSPQPEPDGSDEESVDTFIRRENARDRKAGRL